MNSLEKYTYEDTTVIRNAMERSQGWFLKIIFFLLGILAIILFVPMEVLSIFRRKGRSLHSQNQSGILFAELGPMNVILFLLIPAAILIVLLYFFLFRIPKIKKDFSETEKEVDIVKVKSIKPLSSNDKKDLMGLADYKIYFESNRYGLSDEMFLSTDHPEKLKATSYRVEVTKHARIILKKEIVGS